MQGDHLSKQYNADLEDIRSKVLLMGGMVESQINDAIHAYQLGNLALAETAIKADESVNQLEIAIDDACSHLIVKRQPAANDLRTVMATLKIITDLERVGDESTKVARTAIRLHNRGVVGVDHYEAVRVMEIGAREMLRQVLDAFARLDDKLALSIISQDEFVNYEFRTAMRTMIMFMMEDPRTISTALDVLWVAKALERIGDHAKSIAEYVIFIVEGKDIRHSDHLPSTTHNDAHEVGR